MFEKDKVLYVGLDTACHVTSIDRQTLIRQIKKGNFPGFKIGGQWRVRVADLEALGQPKSKESQSV